MKQTTFDSALTHTLILAGLACTVALPAYADDRHEAVLKLAKASGCLGCHAAEAQRPRPDGRPPIGPTWVDVAARYRGRQGAENRLVQAVVAGSNPYQSHWADKVSGLAMPPNAVAVNEADARQLVKWILSLDATPKP